MKKSRSFKVTLLVDTSLISCVRYHEEDENKKLIEIKKAQTKTMGWVNDATLRPVK